MVITDQDYNYYAVTHHHSFQRRTVRLRVVLCAQNKAGLVASNVVLKNTMCMLQGQNGNTYCH